MHSCNINKRFVYGVVHADSRSEEDEDESDGSNSFDVGTTSEDKNASPVGSQFGFRSPTAMSYSNGKATVAESEPAHSQPHSRVTTQNLTSSPRLTKKKIYAKGTCGCWECEATALKRP